MKLLHHSLAPVALDPGPHSAPARALTQKRVFHSRAKGGRAVCPPPPEGSAVDWEELAGGFQMAPPCAWDGQRAGSHSLGFCCPAQALLRSGRAPSPRAQHGARHMVGRRGGPSGLTQEPLNGWRTPVPIAGTPGARWGL